MGKKDETVEEYVKRGGKITVLPPEPIENINKVTCTGDPYKFLTMEEGKLYYTQKRKRKGGK